MTTNIKHYGSLIKEVQTKFSGHSSEGEIRSCFANLEAEFEKVLKGQLISYECTKKLQLVKYGNQ